MRCKPGVHARKVRIRRTSAAYCSPKYIGGSTSVSLSHRRLHIRFLASDTGTLGPHRCMVGALADSWKNLMYCFVRRLPARGFLAHAGASWPEPKGCAGIRLGNLFDRLPFSLSGFLSDVSRPDDSTKLGCSRKTGRVVWTRRCGAAWPFARVVRSVIG
jgi:hypothetical protein